MDWKSIGSRIRKQREYFGLTREQFAEMLDITPKFCSDIELGVKGMSIPTLCRIAQTLHLSTDYILFGTKNAEDSNHAVLHMLSVCSEKERHYAEELLKVYMLALRSDDANL